MSSPRVVALFTSPEFLVDYEKWLKDPVTRQVLGAASELSVPSSLSKPDPNAALYMHGVYVGFNRMLAFLKGADEVIAGSKEEDISASYGEGKELEEQYPQIARARARVAAREQKQKKAPAA